MSDFERSGMAYDEPAKRRTPGTFFADLGDRLARGFNSFDRPADEEPEWGPYEEPDQPTALADAVPWEPAPSSERFPTARHGYDRGAVDVHLAALEEEIDHLRAQRLSSPDVEAEIERVGEETSAILRVAHEQAAEITRRARVEAEKCVSDAAANAVAMTEDAKRKLRQLDSETDAVWAERGRLIEDVRNVATALFSLAEDAADRFPEDSDRTGTGATVAVAQAATAPPSHESVPAQQPSDQAPQAAAPSPQRAAPQPGAPQPATPAGRMQSSALPPQAPAAATPRPVAAPDALSPGRPD
jgi:hypothetical protein